MLKRRIGRLLDFLFIHLVAFHDVAHEVEGLYATKVAELADGVAEVLFVAL